MTPARLEDRTDVEEESAPVGTTVATGRSRPAVATVATIAAAAGTAALSIDLATTGDHAGKILEFHGLSVGSVVVLAAFVVAGIQVLRVAVRRDWAYAAPLGAVLALADLLGRAVTDLQDLYLLRPPPEQAFFLLVRFVGLGALLTFVLAAVFHWTGGRSSGGRDDAAARPGRLERFLSSLRTGGACVRRRGLLAVFAVLVAARLPFLVVWWPGIVPFDTFRSYAYARGTSPWESYEPVGHSLLVAVTQGLGLQLGLGDVGAVAIGVVTQLVLMSAALTFMLVRLAAWRVDRRVWALTAAWAVLSPVFGLFSVIQVKDVPFACVFLVFVVALAEIAMGPARARRWPWIAAAVSGIAAIMLRNNGVYVVVASLVVLLVARRHLWKRSLATLLACVAGYGLYVGPVYSALNIEGSRQVEMFSVPLQQIARIAREDTESLDEQDLAFVSRMFGGQSAEELGDHYDEGLSDPVKEYALRSWDSHTTGEFLSGWLRLTTAHPGTAVKAFLANTVGYWYPESPLRDVFYTWSRNDIRDVHLDIPSGGPLTEGWRGFVAQNSMLGTDPDETRMGMTTNPGFRGPLIRDVPVVGMTVSPGFVVWIWLAAAVALLHRRRPGRLLVMVPAVVLLLTVMASPVSGSVRYSLGLFLALPVAVAAAAAPSTSTREPGSSGRADEEGTARPPRAEPAAG